MEQKDKEMLTLKTDFSQVEKKYEDMKLGN